MSQSPAGDRKRSIKSTNIQAVPSQVSPDERHARGGHRGGVMWFTGLSASGKSTLAIQVERALFDRGYRAFTLDGDNVRAGLNSDLGFSPEDRTENIRRIGEVAALFAHAGIIVLTAFISPYRSDREQARVAARGGFHEVYIKADLAVCEARDPKGLYKKARAGEIPEFTGISAPYESPESPELVVDTGSTSVEDCTAAIVAYAEQHFVASIAAAQPTRG